MSINWSYKMDPHLDFYPAESINLCSLAKDQRIRLPNVGKRKTLAICLF